MIRLVAVFLFASFIGLFVQAALIHSAFPVAMAPDFILILTVIVSLRYRKVVALCGVYCLGLLADFSSGQLIGPNAAGSVVVFAVVGVIASRVYADKMLAIAMITFVCAMAKSATYLLMFYVYLNPVALGSEIVHLVLLEALFSAICAPVVAKLVGPSRSGFGSSLATSGAPYAGNSSYPSKRGKVGRSRTFRNRSLIKSLIGGRQ